ncbi:MAG TPA: DUF885 domain-containing protein [Terriglobales bacterium]|jgi:uncharacterized protein (DUF885 family)|nr:DUF885 domain-containing protein [Terriglobales bacterium]
MTFRSFLAAAALTVSAVFLLSCSPQKSEVVTPKVDSAKQLHALFDEEWEYELKQSPETSTSLGDNRFNDRLDDYSAEAAQADTSAKQKFLPRFEAIDASGLSRQDALSRELMVRKLKQEIDGAQFKSWEMPVNQMNGPHLSLVDMVTIIPFNNARDYDNYLSRLHQIPRVLDQVTANMRQGMKDHLMQPRYLLEKVAVESGEIATKSGTSSPFAKPADKFPSTISADDQKRLKTAILTAVNAEIVPAYKKFTAFVHDEYAPQGRTDPGVWALPDGEARYRYMIKRMTTTDLTADQIHEIGVKQLAETEAEMIEVAHQLGYKDLAALNDHIKKDRKFYATSGQQVLDLYTKYTRQMEAQLPKLFGRLPKNKLDVIPMDPFRSKNAVPADYSPGAQDGSRAGRINVNEYDPAHRLTLNIEAIAYHEGVPGHHLQISIGQELPDLPSFRKNGEYTAFVEGWALYSERLGKEIGFYQDPYSNYGRLENEMWRDIRLVIDTGVHEKHWTRSQMVEYFHKYTAMDEPNVQSEVDRYIAWPGQALAYKLGQLEILKLREEARQKLGNKFDLKAFHDEIVGSGPLPLDVLHSEIESWIAAQAK